VSTATDWPRLDTLHGYDLSCALARRPDAPLDRLCEVHGPGLAQVLANRSDAPLDRLGELRGSDLAWVLVNRSDAPLDRLGELRGSDLAQVLANRPDAGGVQHPYIDGYEVWQWRGTLTVGCETHTFGEWVRDADEIDQRHGNPGYAPLTRAMALRLIEESVK